MATAIGLAGCSPSLGGDASSGLRLTTDAFRYLAVPDGGGAYQQWHFQVVATLQNDTDTPVYVERCDPTSTSPMFGLASVGAGESAYDPIWACGGIDHQLMLAAHQLRIDTLQVVGPNEFGIGTSALVKQGAFRLSYSVKDCDGFDCVPTMSWHPAAQIDVEVPK